MADHLSRLMVNDHYNHVPILDTFLDEQLFALSTCPWYVDITNYLVTSQVTSQWTPQDRRKFLVEVKRFFFDDPYLNKCFPNQIMRRCVLDSEITGIHSFCHIEACGGHFYAKKRLQRFCSVNFTGLPCSRTPLSSAKHAIGAK